MARRQQLTSFHLVIAAGIALALGFIIGRATSPRKGAEPVEVAAADSGKTNAYVEKALELDASPGKGPVDAPVVLYEISDFQ